MFSSEHIGQDVRLFGDANQMLRKKTKKHGHDLPRGHLADMWISADMLSFCEFDGFCILLLCTL